jgi:hypothetical protein
MNGAAYQPNGAPPQSSSAIAISEGQVYTPEGKAEAYPVPRALEVSEIPGIVHNYAQAARNSLAAGTGHIFPAGAVCKWSSPVSYYTSECLAVCHACSGRWVKLSGAEGFAGCG